MKSGSYLLFRICINPQLKQQSVANKWKTSSQYAPLFLHSRKLRMCYFSSSSSDSRQGHDDDSSTEIRYLENSSIKVSRSQSEINSTSKIRRFIPSPTWSIKELNLSGIADDDESNRDLDKNEELLMNMNRLSQLSLIDISSLSQERQNKIKRNLRSIMKCLNVLNNNDNDANVVDQQAKSPLSDKEIYDSPRGLSCMPLYWNSDNNVEKEDSYFESTRDNLLESVSHRLVSSYDDREKGEEENHKNDSIGDSEKRANKYNESIENEKFFTVVTRTRSER